jgi:hypothetical protein
MFNPPGVHGLNERWQVLEHRESGGGALGAKCRVSECDDRPLDRNVRVLLPDAYQEGYTTGLGLNGATLSRVLKSALDIAASGSMRESDRTDKQVYWHKLFV